jgi:hypothetical protein
MPERNRDAERCPRFDTCNASHCPLSRDGLHLPGEKVCFFLLNSGKMGAAERFQDDSIFAECVKKLPQIAAKYPDIGRAVEKASKTGFRSRHLMKNAPQKPPSGTL